MRAYKSKLNNKAYNKSHTHIMKGISRGVCAVIQQPINPRLILLFPVFFVVWAAGQDVVHNPVACGRREKCVFIINEEKVHLALVEGCGEVVRLGPHDVFWKPERVTEPLQRNLSTFGDVAHFKGHFNL